MGKIIRRILTIIPAVALQSLWLLLLMKWLTPYAPIIVSLLSVAAFFLVVFIIIKRDETAYKLLWLLVILKVATIGTVNLDYRSLFLHFENNSFFYRSSIIAAIKDDFIATQAKCKEVKPYDMKHYSRRWVVDGVLRIFAPLC